MCEGSAAAPPAAPAEAPKAATKVYAPPGAPDALFKFRERYDNVRPAARAPAARTPVRWRFALRGGDRDAPRAARIARRDAWARAWGGAGAHNCCVVALVAPCRVAQRREPLATRAQRRITQQAPRVRHASACAATLAC